MILERQSGTYAIHVIVQMMVVALSFGIFYFVFQGLYCKDLSGGFGGYSSYLGVILIGLLIYALFCRAKEQAVIFAKSSKRIRMTLRQLLAVVGVMLFYLVATKDAAISRAFLFTYIPFIFLVLLATNLLLPGLILKFAFHGDSSEKCLLVCWEFPTDTGIPGSGDKGLKETAEWLRDQARYGMKFAGILGVNEELSKITGLPILGETKDFKEVLKASGTSSVFLIRMPPKDELGEFIDICDAMGIRVSILYNIEEYFGRAMQITTMDGVSILQVRQEPLQNPLNRLLKRLLDISLSSVVVLVIIPLISLILIPFYWIQSPGPIFYKQLRGGRGKKHFTIYKFRSLHAAPTREAEFVSDHDMRLFPLGAFLRRTSLDELPQFINVLKGEMSIVGPRPHLLAHNDLWENEISKFHIRSLIRPGITGLAQVRGHRGEVTNIDMIHHRILCDIDYLENWTIFHDVAIIVLTAWQMVFPPKNAY